MYYLKILKGLGFANGLIPRTTFVLGSYANVSNQPELAQI